jgi:hypothetical protein
MRLRLAVLLLVGGCRDPVLICPGLFADAIEVEVRDESGAPASEGTTGTATNAGIEYTFGIHPNKADLSLLLSVNAFGSFDVRLTKEGHKDWVRTGVMVTGNQCGPFETTLLMATLEPETP